MGPSCPLCGSGEHLHHPRSSSTPAGRLLPIHDPLFNLEAVCLELLALEQHLFDPQKQCSDCILKHLLTAEVLLREVPSLDATKLYADDAVALAEILRDTREHWRLSFDYPGTGQRVRQIRKALVPVCLPLGGRR
jgi:hypothetical protein